MPEDSKNPGSRPSLGRVLPARASTGLRRTAQVALVTRDLAVARGRRPGSERDRVLAHAARRLGLLHGLPQKLGQLMAFSEIEASDPAFVPLTENAPALDPAAAFAVVESSLRCRVADRFRELNPKGISASIGQVHRGVLNDGRVVAVKVQYPGIADSLRWDLRALGWITKPIGGLGRGLDLDAYRDEIGRGLEAELDYGLEAKSICDFGRRTRDWTGLILPQVVPECTSGPVLTMTWVEGEPLAQARWAPRAHREAFAAVLVRLLLHGLFRWRRVHADPHPGNVRFDSGPCGPRVGLLDFGCVHPVSVDWAAGWVSLVQAYSRGTPSDDDLFGGLHGMGFDIGRLEPIASRVRDVMRVVMEPFLTQGAWEPSSWRLGERLAEILGEHCMTFRVAGPPSLIFVLRAFQGVLQYLKIFDVPVHWRELWEEVRPAAGSQVNCERAGRTDRSVVHPVGTRARLGAARLCMRVRDTGRTVVDLRLPSAALGSILEVMPVDVISRLADRGISVEEIARRTLADGCPAGELFSDRQGAREVSVWLEE